MNLNQVTILVTNLTRSIKFYETLGLQLIVEDAHYARFLCPAGNSTFSLHSTTDELLPMGVTIYFECEDLDETVEKLQKQGLQFENDPIDQEWLWREAYLMDPDGYKLCLYYAGVNRLNPPWRINPNN